MPVIKKVLNIADLKIEDLDQITAQVTDYISDLYSIEDIADLMLCLYQDDTGTISVLSSEIDLEDFDLEDFDLSDPDNLLDGVDYFSVREFISSFYTVERLKKDLNDLAVYKLIPRDLLFLF